MKQSACSGRLSVPLLASLRNLDLWPHDVKYHGKGGLLNTACGLPAMLPRREQGLNRDDCSSVSVHHMFGAHTSILQTQAEMKAHVT